MIDNKCLPEGIANVEESFFALRVDDSDTLYLTPYEMSKYLEQMVADNDESVYTIFIRKMTVQQYMNLEEFGGF